MGQHRPHGWSPFLLKTQRQGKKLPPMRLCSGKMWKSNVKNLFSHNFPRWPVRVKSYRIRIRNLYCPYFTEKHQGTRKYINKDIWTPTHYKQTKTLSENTKQWYKIIEYNVERKWQWNDLYTLWHIPQAIAAIIHPVLKLLRNHLRPVNKTVPN